MQPIRSPLEKCGDEIKCASLYALHAVLPLQAPYSQKARTEYFYRKWLAHQDIV